MIFRRLNRSDDRDAFDCGVESVDAYLKRSARQQTHKNLALIFVLVEDESSTEIIGFYTLLMGTVACSAFPLKGLPLIGSAPIVLLAQLGVDRRWQGQGHGTRLLYGALSQVMLAADHVGCLAVVLNPVDDHAAQFYKSRGFLELGDQSRRLFLPMSSIRRLFAEDPSAET